MVSTSEMGVTQGKVMVFCFSNLFSMCVHIRSYVRMYLYHLIFCLYMFVILLMYVLMWYTSDPLYIHNVLKGVGVHTYVLMTDLEKTPCTYTQK